MRTSTHDARHAQHAQHALVEPAVECCGVAVVWPGNHPAGFERGRWRSSRHVVDLRGFRVDSTVGGARNQLVVVGYPEEHEAVDADGTLDADVSLLLRFASGACLPSTLAAVRASRFAPGGAVIHQGRVVCGDRISYHTSSQCAKL